jgi:uncharacterized membrane protein YphA (DoxX/SURF4 family)
MKEKITIKNILFILLSVALGVVFIFSAWSKIPTLEQFGWIIVENTFLGWDAAEILARALIGLEFFIGILFLSCFRIKKLAIPLAFITLLLFSAYLVLIFIQHGNNSNCGCFGEVLPMTPLASLVKNGILLAVIYILHFIKTEWRIPYDRWIVLGLFATCLSIPFIASIPDCFYLYDKPKLEHNPIPLSLLYHSPNNKAPEMELRKGKHIIAFMSLTCEHCRKAAKKIRIMNEKHPEIPFYFVLNGDSSNVEDFFEDTKSQQIPHSLFNGVEQFVAMAGNKGVPSIKWMEDTIEIKHTNYIILKDKDVLAWLKK